MPFAQIYMIEGRTTEQKRAVIEKVTQALTEAVGAEEAGRIAGMKKADMADAAERLLEGRGWLPPVLRTTLVEEPDAEAASSEDDAYPFAAE